MMMGKSKRWICSLLIGGLALSNLPVYIAAEGGPYTLDNLLAADMDTHFDGGVSPFTPASGTTGGSQKIVSVNGNNALEFRDASLGTNLSSSFYYQLNSGRLKDRMNEIYNMPVGSSPVEFVFSYKLMRSAASNKPVAKDIYAQIQLAPYDNNLIPRFPADMPSISGTAAYLNTVPDELKIVNDSDLASYRFKVYPNGGQKNISSVKVAFSVRVDTGGTDEAYLIDDLAISEVKSEQTLDTEAPTAPSQLTLAGKSDTSVNLNWTASTDNVGVTRYDIYRDGLLVDNVSGVNTAYGAIGLSPNTTYRYLVKARDAAGNLSAASNEVAVTTDPSVGGLPEPLGDRDIGNVKPAGSASYNPVTGRIKVQGSGSDIFGTEDAFHYVYRPWTGNGQVVARVYGIENGVTWTKAGVMIRASMSEQSPNVMTALTPANGAYFQDRLQAGGASTSTAGTQASPPYWVKLVRKDNVISAYDSSDGTNWTLIKKEAMSLPDTVYFGLAVTSHNTGRLAAAEFDQVSIGEVPPAESTNSPFPGTVESRKQWLWDKTKTMSEMGLQLNIVQYVAQIVDGQNVALNLQKIDKMFQAYDAEQYKTVSKMYAYLMVGNQFSSTMVDHVKAYFAQYAYAKLPQTENLRMSNYTAGYLVGQSFPDLQDLNGKSGAVLKSENRANIEEMLSAGVRYGWAEYESPEYTFMTYFCLNALYQYTDEPDFKQKLKMAMDVMWFEWANDWIDGTFISTSNRAKGDSVSASDLTWRGADHTALSWMYFGGNRAQEGIGETDALVPSAYRPYLEYLGMVLYRGMSYTPPEMAIRIGQSGDKSYTSRKTNLQNSSGRNLKTYRQAFVKPTWGLATEVTYNRVDNWIEDLPVVLRWHSAKANPLFRVNADQGDSPIGNYDQPANHRIMQDGKAAVGVYKLLNSPTSNYLNAMFPDTGSIITREEQSGWVFNNAGPMYFAFKLIKPYSWYYQTPTDPSNKVKTTTKLHPTSQLTYSYNILRSQADKNGWVLETADASEYANFASFKNAILTNTTVDSSHIDEANPRLIYRSLSGDSLDITFDEAANAYNNTHKINGNAINYGAFKLFDTPWLQQDQNANLFTATQGGEVLTYDFANWTISRQNNYVAVPNSSFENGAASPENWTDRAWAGSSVRTWDTVTSRTYNHSVKIANTASGDYGGWSLADSSLIAVNPATAYTLKAWVKTDNVNAVDGAHVGITYYKSDGTTVTGSTYLSTNVRGTNNWTPIEATATAPADAAKIRLDVRLKGTGMAWFDDVELLKQAVHPVTGVTLNKGTLSMASGITADLIATVLPAEATNKTVTWSSNNPSVATVDAYGKVTAAAPGTAVITVITADGAKSAACVVTVTLEPLFEDSFAAGIGKWDLFGSTDWQVQGSGTEAQLAGTTTATFPQRAVVKPSLLPYSTANYNLTFTAKGDRFRTMFRYASSTGYYFLEFKNTKVVELWKYPNSSVNEQVGTLVDIGAVLPGFNLTDWHQYQLEVNGSTYKLIIDGIEAATFTDASLTAGGIGFSLKSVGAPVSVNVKNVVVKPIINSLPGGN
ncbi:Ig-like domain-containing protein [Paenibacillus alba]|uniref:Ig-like domain-containing protein n=1 Tax=Paenibacillus alba TaxID=1197127 RepID=UPI001C2065B2|nr:Ig-like domain-containing protein [Paenibacillus alba]